MENDLKFQNITPLTTIYFGALFFIALVHWSIEEEFTLTNQLAVRMFVMVAVTAFGAVLSNLLPNSVKHILIYFRFSNVLPGHRCKKICIKDPRLSITNLKIRWPELFVKDMNESAQNSYWYKEIYLPVRNTPEVLQAHRSFLLYRDAASGLFILLIGLLTWRFLTMYVSLSSVGLWPLLLLTGFIIVLSQAGRQSGNRMVANSVAVALLSEKEDAIKRNDV